MNATIEIQNQGSEGSCFAHAVARIVNHFLRISDALGVSENNGHQNYQFILDWIIQKYGAESGIPERVLSDLLQTSLKNPVIPPDLKSKLEVFSVVNSFGFNNPTNRKQLKDALREHRELVFSFAMEPHQFESISFLLTPIFPDSIPKSKRLPIEQRYGHSVVLYAWNEDGNLCFKNSWGITYGINEKFAIHQSTSITFRLDNLRPKKGVILPEKYRNALHRC